METKIFAENLIKIVFWLDIKSEWNDVVKDFKTKRKII